MRARPWLALALLLIVLVAACTPPTEEQLAAWAAYSAARATEAAANQQIAAAKATEAAAAAEIARLTVAASQPLTATAALTTTAALADTATPEPPTATPVPPTVTPTETPSPTPVPPTATPVPPTATPVETPSPTPVPPTATPVPPTATPSPTPIPPTATPTSTPSPTPIPPTATPVPPTATPTRMPSPTPVPPTATPVPPTATSAPPTPTRISAVDALATAAAPRTTPSFGPRFPPLLFFQVTPVPGGPAAEPPAAATPVAPTVPPAAVTSPAAVASPTAVTSPTATSTPAIPTATPTPPPAGAVAVTSAQANLRGGPGMDFPVVGEATAGQSFDVTGSNAGQTWWQVCCVDGRPGWVSSSIVAFSGDAAAVPVVGPLLPDDLEAAWDLRWECHAEGCPQDECFGESQATTLQARTERWLEVQREATWAEECGEREEWITQVDRYTGREQTVADPPLFEIWAGASPGPANRAVDLLDRTLALWCTDTRTREVDQGSGWTVVYEGDACYDTRSGVLVTLQYVKRWLFSGEFEGQQYDRAYFGDYEVYQQILTSTNAPLTGD